MYLEYEVKFIDYFKFQLAHQFFSVTLQIIYLIVPVMELISGIFADDGTSLEASLFSAIFIYLLEMIALVIFSWFYFSLKKDHIILTQHKLTISEAGINQITKYAQSSFYWNNKMQLTERMDNVCIYISANIAILIPERAFQSNEQREELVKLVHDMTANSKL